MDTLFFIASKLIAVLLRADTWLVVVLVAIILALTFQRRRLALWISQVALALILLLGFFPAGDLLLQPLERQYPTNPHLVRVDGIIVLGGGEDARGSAYWNQVQLNDSAERFTAALELARRFPEARIIFAGGSGALSDLGSETTASSSAAERFFLEQGISPERLMLERQSRNTAENARLSRGVANPEPGQTWVLVTSAFHMPRAMQSFGRAGWQGVIAWPVDYRTTRFQDHLGWNLTRNLAILNIAVRERIGQLAYSWTDR